MGVPVKTIKKFEEDLKYSQKKWTMIIFANAYSDSKAVDFVIRNFHEMDVVSDDVDFYLPGFDVYDLKRSLQIGLDELSWRNEMLESYYTDCLMWKNRKRRRVASFYCFKPLDERPLDEKEGSYCKIIDSPRLGPIVFNEAEFADFVMEFTRRKKGYVYLGTCQMLLVPVSEGIPDYQSAAIYDLDKVVDCPAGPSLDSFFHHVLYIIRQFGYKQNGLRSMMDYLLGRQSAVLREIDRLYSESTHYSDKGDKYEIIINNIIVDMEKWLNWSLKEDYFFISYSSRNVTKAKTLKWTMQKHGLHVWIAPDGIPQGRNYAIVVPTALKLSKTFVLLLTPESARSQWVKRELDIAISNEANTRVKVLLADGFSISDIQSDNELMFYLNRVQVKYEYYDVVHDETVFERFISE